MGWFWVRIKFFSFHIVVYDYLNRPFGYMCIFCVCLFAIPLTIIPSLIPVYLRASNFGGTPLFGGESFTILKLFNYLKTFMLTSASEIINVTFAELNTAITRATPDLNFQNLVLLGQQVFHKFLYN